MKKWFKRLLPVVMAIMLCFGSCLTVFAAVEFVPPLMPEGYNGYTAFCKGGRTFCYVYVQDDYKLMRESGTNNFKVEGLVSEPSPIYMYTYLGSYDPSVDWGEMAVVDFSNANYFIPTSVDEFIVSTSNVYYSDGTLFFPKTLLPILEPIAKEAGMEKVLEQILLILPIGLVCLVGWIALRKALSHLQGVLRQA